MKQQERELRLDLLIDQLIAGDEPDVEDDPDLAAFCTIARYVRQQRVGRPLASFESHLASVVSARLRGANQIAEFTGHAPESLPLVELPAVNLATTQKPFRRRRSWTREIAQAVAAALLLVLVGALLVALLDSRIHSDGAAKVGAQPGSSGRETSSAKPVPPQTVWDVDPTVKSLHERGLGKDLHLVQEINGYTVALNWAGDDGNRIFLFYSISGPKNQTFNSMSLFHQNLTTADGANLNGIAGSGVAGNDAADDVMDWYDSSGLPKNGSLELKLTVPALLALVPVAPNGTPPAGVHVVTPESGSNTSSDDVPYGPGGLPQSQYRVGDPIAFLTIPGPFTFDFSVPVTPLPTTATPTASTHTPATSITLEDAKRSVRNLLNDPVAQLDGHLVDTSSHDTEILYPSQPGKPLYLITRKDQDLPTRDTFIVDANGGAVLRAYLPSRANDTPLSAPLDDNAARAIAVQFARDHFPGEFDQLSPVDYPFTPDRRYLSLDSQAATTTNEITFDWRLRSSANDRWLPTWITVDVDRGTGEVVQYVARMSGTEGIAPPTLTKQQAIQIALTDAAHGGSTVGISVTDAELVTTFSNQQRDIWVWMIELRGIPVSSNGAAVDGVSVDARSGKVVGEVSSRP